MRSTSLLSLPILIAVVGCGGSFDDGSPGTTFGATPPDALTSLRGDVGELRDVDHPATLTLSSYNYDGRALDYVALDAFWDDGRWAMLGLDFVGGLDHEDLASGETLHFVRDSWQIDADVQPADLFVAATGCADPDLRDDVEMYDESALVVDVTRGVGSDVDVIHVSASFEDGNTLTGQFPTRR